MNGNNFEMSHDCDELCHDYSSYLVVSPLLTSTTFLTKLLPACILTTLKAMRFFAANHSTAPTKILP